MSDQPDAGATSETAQTCKTIHTKHTHPFIPTRRIWNDDYGGQIIFGDLVGLKFPDICLTGEEKPRKNLTQETCPDRGSNPGPLRDKRACYHLLHSGGQLLVYKCKYEYENVYEHGDGHRNEHEHGHWHGNEHG